MDVLKAPGYGLLPRPVLKSIKIRLMVTKDNNFEMLLYISLKDSSRPQVMISEVTKSQRNRRRQRRLKIFPKHATFKAWKINIK